MWIKNLIMSGQEWHFSKGKNYVSDELFQAVKSVLLREKYNGTVTATVIINDTNYTVNLKGGTITVCLYDETNVTNEYQRLLDLSPEQKHFLDFDYKKALDYSKRFMFYRDINYYYPKKELRKDTFGISETRCFRNHLNGFVQEFQSTKLYFDSKYRLCYYEDNLDKEQLCFECFCVLSKFWNGFNKIRDINQIVQPLTVRASKVPDLPFDNRQIFIKENTIENLA